MFSSNTSAVSGAANYIEDVFSTYLYTGNSTSGGTQTITNNIDLSTKGGMVWIKGRSAVSDNILTDTTRGAGASATNNNALASNLTSAEDLGGSSYDFLSAFNTDGFTVKQGGTTTATRGTNYNNVTFTSWTFRKQAKFFDVVTYTGNGSNRTIAHSLGSVPGCIIVKRTDTTGAWAVYHRSLANTEYMVLDTTAAKATGATYWNSTTATSTDFSLGTATDVNANSGTYVAYLFAHDAGGFGLTGTDNVISCGSFTTDGSGKATVNLGYEPQFLIHKATAGTESWLMLDTMRGWNMSTADSDLFCNAPSAEASGNYGDPTATGFTAAGLTASRTYIYIAIRRGPMKTPTSGTSVFAVDADSASSVIPTWDSGFPVDMAFAFDTLGGGGGQKNAARLLGGKYLLTPSTDAEATDGSLVWDSNLGWGKDYDVNRVWYSWMFRRAPGFFDVVCYAPTNTDNQVISHNLGVKPELVIIKQRVTYSSINRDWAVGSPDILGLNSNTLSLNNNYANGTLGYNLFFGQPTSTVVTLHGNENGISTNGATYVMYLFATVAGVSKVGSYTGTGTTKQIDCGFTNGSRFVLIKRTDSTGDWYVWDSARGIVSGNDPYLLLNSTAAEVTNTDYVDTYSAGFEISSTAPAAINANGGSFIFLAIA